jgi:hypothetical protein
VPVHTSAELCLKNSTLDLEIPMAQSMDLADTWSLPRTHRILMKFVDKLVRLRFFRRLEDRCDTYN